MRGLRRYLALLLWMSLSVTGSAGEWPTYHGGGDLRGYSEVQLPKELEMLWRVDVGGAVYSTPVSDGVRIYVSAKKGRVLALGLDGSIIWERRLTRMNDAGQEVPLRMEAPLAVFDGVLLAGSVNGVLYALEAERGSLLWEYDTGGTILGSVNRLAAGDEFRVVVIDQSDGSLHAVGLKSGVLAWKSAGLERCDGSPGVWGERIVFGSCAAALHLFSEAGVHVTNVVAGGEAQLAGGVAIGDGLAYAGGRDGGLVCVDLMAGELVWRLDVATEPAFGTPAVTGDRVLFSSDDGGVYAATAGRGGGALIWRFETEGTPSSPVVAGDKVAVSVDGALLLLDLKSGERVWSQSVSDEISSPAVIAGRLVIGADDGTVAVFGEKK
jgi:eukaryotic-like serine/threonine-protein kinase